MVDIVRTRRTFIPGSAPTSLEEGQLAINVPDKIIWIGDTGNLPVKIFDASEDGGGVNDHDDLINIGTIRHVDIDAHIQNTNNPHLVSWEDLVGEQPDPVDHTHPLAEITDSGTMAAEDDAPADAQPYVREDAGWKVALGADFTAEQVIGGDGIIAERPGDGTVIIHSSDPQSFKARYLWNEAIVGEPGLGYMLADEALTGNMTQLHVDHVDADGVDRSQGAGLVEAGETVILVHEPSSALATFTTVGPAVDMGSYSLFPVIFDAGDGTINPATDDSMVIQWFPSEGEEVVPPHLHDHDTDLTNVGTHTHAAIDNHIDDNTTNPHNVTFAQTGPPSEFPPEDHDHDSGVF